MSVVIVAAAEADVQALYVDGQKKAVIVDGGPDLWDAAEILAEAGALEDLEIVNKTYFEGVSRRSYGFDVYDEAAWPATLADALRMLGEEQAQPVSERTEL